MGSSQPLPLPVTAANVCLISLTSGPPMCKQNEGSERGKDLNTRFLSLEDIVKWDRAWIRRLFNFTEIWATVSKGTLGSLIYESFFMPLWEGRVGEW